MTKTPLRLNCLIFNHKQMNFLANIFLHDVGLEIATSLFNQNFNYKKTTNPLWPLNIKAAKKGESYSILRLFFYPFLITKAWKTAQETYFFFFFF